MENRIFITMSMSKKGVEIKLSIAAKTNEQAIAIAEKEADGMVDYSDEIIHTFVLLEDPKCFCISRTEKVPAIAQ